MAEANPPRGKMRFRRNAVRALPAVLESLFPSSSAGMLQHSLVLLHKLLSGAFKDRRGEWSLGFS
jgi:hypothetical protein